MSVILPAEKLDSIKDINGNSIKSLISNNGSLVSEGGFITLSVQQQIHLLLSNKSWAFKRININKLQ